MCLFFFYANEPLLLPWIWYIYFQKKKKIRMALHTENTKTTHSKLTMNLRLLYWGPMMKLTTNLNTEIIKAVAFRTYQFSWFFYVHKFAITIHNLKIFTKPFLIHFIINILYCIIKINARHFGVYHLSFVLAYIPYVLLSRFGESAKKKKKKELHT